MADCDGEKTVTMMDVLREQQDFEEDANAVLGASDDKNCTYAKGYVKRQAIYACLTCCPDAVSDSTKRAGVCLACSLACHENHELVELYTKRNFRCDCGNPKFTHPCQFTPNKTDLNYENKYNQNFSGIYCSCKRPYPDPEATEEEEMIQCIVCEDWLHTNHLEATVPSNEQYAEMICKDCMEDIDFLHDYSELVVNVEDKEIIVMDPDLDVSNIIKANESPQKVLSNDPAEAESQKVLSNGLAEAESQKVLSNGLAEAESKDKDETVPETKESNLEDKQDEKTTDIEMSEPKPDEEGKRTTDGEIGESKPDESGDGTDSFKENAEQAEHKTEASGDANPDTTATATKENQEVDNSEKKNENNEPETNKESDDKENSADQINPDESAEKISECASEPKTTDDSTIAEPEESERAKDKETTESETTDKEKAEADPVSDNKDDTITTNEDVPADAKPQDEEMKEDNSNNATSDKENELPTNKAEHKRKLSEGNIEVSPKKQKLDSNPCVRPRGVKRVYKGATFWPTTLRQKLCTCAECLSMYKDLAVLFLIDSDDTVTAYETLGKDNDGATSSQYEKGLQALSSLDRVQQINALTEYNKMRDKLLDFLKSFKDRKEIVKEEDIKAFFAGMKPKREPDGVYFCR